MIHDRQYPLFSERDRQDNVRRYFGGAVFADGLSWIDQQWDRSYAQYAELDNQIFTRWVTHSFQQSNPI